MPGAVSDADMEDDNPVELLREEMYSLARGLGMTGAGLVWLAAFPLFTAILLGLRPAVVSIGLATGTCTVFGVLLALGVVAGFLVLEVLPTCR